MWTCLQHWKKVADCVSNCSILRVQTWSVNGRVAGYQIVASRIDMISQAVYAAHQFGEMRAVSLKPVTIDGQECLDRRNNAQWHARHLTDGIDKSKVPAECTHLLFCLPFGWQSSVKHGVRTERTRLVTVTLDRLHKCSVSRRINKELSSLREIGEYRQTQIAICVG